MPLITGTYDDVSGLGLPNCSERKRDRESERERDKEGGEDKGKGTNKRMVELVRRSRKKGGRGKERREAEKNKKGRARVSS